MFALDQLNSGWDKKYLNMRYYSTIALLIFFNLITVFFLMYFSNISKQLEIDNKRLSQKIKIVKEDLKVNELEFITHNNYTYLLKLQKIYLDINFQNTSPNSRITFNHFKDKYIQNIHSVGTK